MFAESAWISDRGSGPLLNCRGLWGVRACYVKLSVPLAQILSMRERHMSEKHMRLTGMSNVVGKLHIARDQSRRARSQEDGPCHGRSTKCEVRENNMCHMTHCYGDS